MMGIVSIVAVVFSASGLTGEYDITEVLLYYQDTSDYKLTISQDGDFFHFDWEASEGYKNREIGFEFEDYVGAYDFENCGLGIYKKEGDCLAGFRVYPVVMRLLQVTSCDGKPMKRPDVDLSGFWDLEITDGTRRITPVKMNLHYREDGDYWDGGEFDSDFHGVSGGWGLAAEDVLVMGFQNLDIGGITLGMYKIEGDTLEGRWIEGYYDFESGKTTILSSGTERAIRRPGTQ